MVDMVAPGVRSGRDAGGGSGREPVDAEEAGVDVDHLARGEARLGREPGDRSLPKDRAAGGGGMLGHGRGPAAHADPTVITPADVVERKCGHTGKRRGVRLTRGGWGSNTNN